jgi:hypothetical protein
MGEIASGYVIRVFDCAQPPPTYRHYCRWFSSLVSLASTGSAQDSLITAYSASFLVANTLFCSPAILIVVARTRIVQRKTERPQVFVTCDPGTEEFSTWEIMREAHREAPVPLVAVYINPFQQNYCALSHSRNRVGE